MAEQSNREWLEEQVAKVPGAELRTTGSFARVWALEYMPPEGPGWLPMRWWLRPGSAIEAPMVQAQPAQRTLTAQQLHVVGALCIALAAWLEGEPAPQEAML